jgi:mannose-6-phosphate isomerase-like protein (cupin superfamily)
MNRRIGAIILMAIGMVTARTFAQATTSLDVYSPADLMAMEKKLAQKADASGLASEQIKKYSVVDFTTLAFRNQSGKAELHEKVADFFVVIDGSATLISGGHVVNPATTTPGEVRGDSIQGGKETKLKKGDVVHIPPNTPHQLMLAKGDTFRYFVIKVQEVN